MCVCAGVMSLSLTAMRHEFSSFTSMYSMTPCVQRPFHAYLVDERDDVARAASQLLDVLLRQVRSAGLLVQHEQRSADATSIAREVDAVTGLRVTSTEPRTLS